MPDPDREPPRRRVAMIVGLLSVALAFAACVWWYDNAMSDYREQRTAKEAAAAAVEKAAYEKRMESERLAREVIAEAQRRQGETRGK